jgi:hypothetical protein
MPEQRPKSITAGCAAAMLAGKKTQVRQVVNADLPGDTVCTGPDEDGVFTWMLDSEVVHQEKCPMGTVGDSLWMQEPWFTDNDGEGGVIIYRADNPGVGFHWKPAKEMPRWASRIEAEIIRIDVQRIQEISDHDIDAEGGMWNNAGEILPAANRKGFAEWWNSVNVRPAGKWEANPWVWVIELRQ